MSYRDSVGIDGFCKESDYDPEADGVFQKASGDVFYTWEPNRLVRKKRTQLIIQTVVASIIAFFISVGLLVIPSDFVFVLPKLTLSSLDYKVFLVFSVLLAGLVICYVLYRETIVARRRDSSSFVDLDERSSSRKMDMQIRELKDSIRKLRTSAEVSLAVEKEETKGADSKEESNAASAVENYIHGITKSLDRHIELSEKKASKLLDTGTMYLRRGIYFYVASIFVWQIVAHVWGVDKQLVFGVVSCSLTFLVVEFLAAWFLKQYRSFIDSSIQFMRVKSVFDRYLLSYYAVREFSGEGTEGLVESKAQVLKVLSEEIKWPETLNSKSADMNHMVQMFDSLAGVLEKVKRVSTKSEQGGV